MNSASLFPNPVGAIFSPCGLFRYWLERDVQAQGIVIAFLGVNPSTAGVESEDQTSLKWRGFTVRNGGRRYIAGNPFALCATKVSELATAEDPVGPENAHYLRKIIREADLLVPCWGSRTKIPKALHPALDALLAQLLASCKPVKVFGLTESGDPKHPLMLGYDTPLVPYVAPHGVAL